MPFSPTNIDIDMDATPAPSLKRAASYYFTPAKRQAIFGATEGSMMSPGKALVLKGLKIDFAAEPNLKEGETVSGAQICFELQGFTSIQSLYSG
jgi:hypothetical protein